MLIESGHSRAIYFLKLKRIQVQHGRNMYCYENSEQLR